MKLNKKKTKKFFLYFFGKILCAAFAVALAWFAFSTAMNTSNVQIMVKDAFAKRASVILKPEDNSDRELLSRIFTNDYLFNSGLYTQHDNRFYNVSLYMQRTDVELKIITPLASKTEITVSDVVDDIRATLVNEDDSDFEQRESLMDSGKYKVTVIKNDEGEWMIDNIELIEEIEPEVVRPLPTPSLTDDEATTETEESADMEE